MSNYYVQQLSRGNVCIPDVDTAYTVKVCSGHTLKCHCQQFAGTNDFCCHVTAIAEKGRYLQKFLAIYAKNGDDLNRVVQTVCLGVFPSHKDPRSISTIRRSSIYIFSKISSAVAAADPA